MERENKFRLTYQHDETGRITQRVIKVGQPIPEIGERWGKPVAIDEYIGLHDKNGKEIYEGDIIQIDKDGQVWSVEYDELSARFIVYNQLNSNRDFNFDYEQTYVNCPIVEVYSTKAFYPEVIGNIYENPELI